LISEYLKERFNHYLSSCCQISGLGYAGYHFAFFAFGTTHRVFARDNAPNLIRVESFQYRKIAVVSDQVEAYL